MGDNDTIFATATGAPPAAIAIVRVSGPEAFTIAAGLVGRLPAARHAAVKSVRDPVSRVLLDRAVVLVFPAPRTATGEDIAEFHVHGGRAVVAVVEAAIATCAGARRAQPGEFTRRALRNGVIDLIGAEGLGDLLAAETETQRRAALRMVEGGLRVVIDGWAMQLVAIAARIEAQLDFSDEDDVPDEALASIVEEVTTIAARIDALLQQPPIERLHDGVRVVIAGPPNSGKSTLLNALAGRDLAIVSAISGTTRDRIEASVVRDGVAYVLTDTAGITQTPGDEIERIGVARAEAAILGGDIVLWLGDEAPVAVPAAIRVHARCDLPTRQVPPADAHIAVSVAMQTGIASLWDMVAVRAAALLPAEDAVATNQRQRALLEDCARNLRAIGRVDDPLIIAEELRLALVALNAIAGRSGVEDVLDALFSKFCIGK